MTDPYKLLGVDYAADDAQIKKAYHALARRYHPDRFADDPVRLEMAGRKMRDINAAYEQIMADRARGIRGAAAYAREHGIKLTEFLPQYERYGRAAPIVRNKEIVDYADKIIAFWDGSSKGTLSVIKYAQKIGKPCEIILCT